MEHVEYGWNTGGIQASGRSFGIRGKRIQTVGVRGGVGERLLFRRPPHAADLQGGGGGRRRQHQQAGAQGAYRLDQQAKEQASDKRLLVLGPSGGCPRRLALQTGPSTLPVIM